MNGEETQDLQTNPGADRGDQANARGSRSKAKQASQSEEATRKGIEKSKRLHALVSTKRPNRFEAEPEKK